MSHQDLCY